MSPFFDYFGMLRRWGFDLRHAPRTALWVGKLLLSAPWRQAERLQRWWRPEPRVLAHPPVFILGYYRSGTTHLQEVLLQDPQFGYLDFYQCFFADAFNMSQRWLERPFDAIVRAVGLLHPAHRIPFTFSLPGEEDVSLLFGAVPEASNWGQVFTRHFKELYGRTALFLDEQPADVRQGFLDALADLHWRSSKSNGHRRMLFKSPPHTGRLAALRELYPDARFVFIRRDPFDVFASNKRLWHSFSLTWLQDIDAAEVRENILWSHDLAHANYERDKQLLAPNQLCELSFEDFLEAPIDNLQRIYETLELGDFDAVRPRMEAYLAREHVSEPPDHDLTDLEVSAVQARLGRWLRAWGYPRRSSERGAA